MTNLVNLVSSPKSFREIDGIFDNFFKYPNLSEFSRASSTFGSSWLPNRIDATFENTFKNTFKLDVFDSENEYVVEAEMPGVSKEDVTLDFNDGKLTIAMNTVKESDEGDIENQGENNTEVNKKYLHRERHATSTSRSLYLADANGEAIKAKLDSGILTVTVPKIAPEIKAHKIEIE